MQPLPFPIFDGFTAAASLSLSTDGPLDPKLRDLAHAYDLAAALNQPRPARIGKVTLKPAAIIRIMAVAIEKAVTRCGAVHRADFHQIGLSDAEIDTHYRDALLRASAQKPSLFISSEAA